MFLFILENKEKRIKEAYNLNTSYVLIYLNRTPIPLNPRLKFKYILCSYLSMIQIQKM